MHLRLKDPESTDFFAELAEVTSKKSSITPFVDPGLRISKTTWMTTRDGSFLTLSCRISCVQYFYFAINEEIYKLHTLVYDIYK